VFFLALCLVLSGISVVLQRLLTGAWRQRAALRQGLAGGFLFTGIDHFVNTQERYVPMMPALLADWAVPLVLFTGVAEILGGVGLLVPLAVYERLRLPNLRWWAGIGLAVLLGSVVIANVNVAMQGESVKGLEFGSWYAWVRPLLQPVIIAWALYAGGVWPRARGRGDVRQD
jgi:uncharacterized membrane protein